MGTPTPTSAQYSAKLAIWRYGDSGLQTSDIYTQNQSSSTVLEVTRVQESGAAGYIIGVIGVVDLVSGTGGPTLKAKVEYSYSQYCPPGTTSSNTGSQSCNFSAKKMTITDPQGRELKYAVGELRIWAIESVPEVIFNSTIIPFSIATTQTIRFDVPGWNEDYLIVDPIYRVSIDNGGTSRIDSEIDGPYKSSLFPVSVPVYGSMFSAGLVPKFDGAILRVEVPTSTPFKADIFIPSHGYSTYTSTVYPTVNTTIEVPEPVLS